MIRPYADSAMPYANQQPYICVRKPAEQIQICGQQDAIFGHKLPSPTHRLPDGVFAEWHWNGAQLVVCNDRYGFYPLFWCRLPSDGVCVSSSIVTLIEQGADTTLDLDALAVFVRLGYFVGDDTPFAAIKAVPPNALFRWQDGALECRARPPEPPKAALLSRDDAIDTFIDLFARAISKRQAGGDNLAVPISGGRDSRHILLELHRTGRVPKLCISALDNPPDPNQDPIVGKQVSEELGFRHVTIDQRLSVFAAAVRQDWEAQFCTMAHGWYLALADFIPGRFNAVFDGIAGDVLSQSGFLDRDLDNLSRTCDPATVAAAWLTKHGADDASLRAVLNGPLKMLARRDRAVHRLACTIEQHMNTPNPIGSFIFWNRTRRQTALAPYALMHGAQYVYAPFMDHDLFDFMSTLPASMLMDRTFHDDAIARAYPAFAHIPYADHKHAPPADDTGAHRRFAAEASHAVMLAKPLRLAKNIAPRAKILLTVLSNGHVRPYLSPLLIYLAQIEALLTGATHKVDCT